MKTFLRKYKIEIVVSFVGAATMILEIVGLNIIAPHFGTALTVSSILLGGILFSLSLGYWFGGVLADRYLDIKILSSVLISAGLYLGMIFAFKDFIAGYVEGFAGSIVRGVAITTILLFAPINVIFGMVLPYAVKLRVRALPSAGKDGAALYVWSTVGSILGTFATGLLLIPFVSLPTILFLLSAALLVMGVSVIRSYVDWVVAIPIIGVLFIVGANASYTEIAHRNDAMSIDGAVVLNKQKLKKLDDVNSQYSRLEVYEGIDEKSGRLVRLLRVNRELHAGTFLDSNELIFKYAKMNRLAGHFNPQAKKALLIGGGGYSYAKYFLGDTPLHDIAKIWKLDGKYYGNENKIVKPMLFSINRAKRAETAKLNYQSSDVPWGSQIEGTKNSLEVENQAPSNVINIKEVDINETGIKGDVGFVHVHETKSDGTLGAVISPNYYVNRPRLIIGHSDPLHGEQREIPIKLDRYARNGEVLYAMLHRDNGNNRFDPLLVDGYENIEFLDVVEIDPKTTELAKKYLHLNTDDPRLRIFHEDGRTYINRVTDTYDIIYLDVMRNFYSIPFQLTTREVAERLRDRLNDHGVVLVNIPSALSGDMGTFFQAEYKTYKSVFPVVKVFVTGSPRVTKSVQNIVLLGFKSSDIRTTFNDDEEINAFLKNEWRGYPQDPNASMLTDDFAPVDYFINAMVNIPVM